MTYRDVKKLWKGFSDLVEALDSEPGQESFKTPVQFKDHARKWARFFREVHHDEDVTPYIHALVYHVPQFLEKCGGLSIFQLPASGKEKPPTIKNVPPGNTEGRTEIQLHKASYGKRKQKNLCQSKQSLQKKENISEKWAYR